MGCFHPIKARRDKGGSVTILGPLHYSNSPFDGARYGYEVLILPCGKCDYCLMERSRQWAVRCINEAQMHKDNCFITLTYDEEYLPYDFSLDYSHFQKFMKRLRRYFKVPVRFYMAGEYGSKNHRPHYHACLFGINFPDRLLWKTTDAGYQIYRSATLERLWPFGFASVGEMNFQTAAYTARYLLKKAFKGDKDYDRIYEVTEVSSGEIHQRVPEFTRMSLKPGIGAAWFDLYNCDVYPHDCMVVRGAKCRPPRYYDKLLDRVDPDLFAELRESRKDAAIAVSADNTPERLKDKEICFKARTASLKRGLS